MQVVVSAELLLKHFTHLGAGFLDHAGDRELGIA
jgi:hypothetical protein